MRRVTGDGGAVAVTVALLAIVLLGFSALAIDVARLHGEKQELRHGADAAALAVAQSCGSGACDMADLDALLAMARRYADANASDDASALDPVEPICGEGAPGLPACADPPDNVPGNGYVIVKTVTRTPNDGTIVPPVFADLLPGDTYDGSINASAIAAWGVPAGTHAQLPLTFSLCELTSLTTAADGSIQYADDEAPTADPSLEQVVYFHDSTSAGLCPAGPSGADLPGGFGWLDSESCEAEVVNGWYGDKTGAAIPNDCKKSNPECKFDAEGNPLDGCLEKYVNQIIRIPVYDMTNGLTGTNGQYHLATYAAFYMTGYRFPSASHASPTLGVPCVSSETCISGYFVETTNGGGQVTSGNAYGLTVVQLVG